MEVFVRFNYNGTLLTNGNTLILGKPEQIFSLTLDNPVNKLIQQIDEAILFMKQNKQITNATLKEIKQVKSENKSYFSMFSSTDDNLLNSRDKTLKDVLTLEPGKRVILDVQLADFTTLVQGGRRRSRRSRKSRKSIKSRRR